jgi:hypothetical protein
MVDSEFGWTKKKKNNYLITKNKKNENKINFDTIGAM